MDISLKNIIPIPLAEAYQQSGIWGKEINFSQGNNYSILAPSGKGKSTFAHILYGLRKDYTGDLFWDQTKFNTLGWEEIQAKRRENFSLIFQDLRLFPELTALDNIRIYKEDEAVDELKITSWFKQLGIEDQLGKKVEVLSYGQQQRVAIIRALSRPFKWLIMDEPFSHLDQVNENKCAELINIVTQEYQANIISTALDQSSSQLRFDQEYNL